MFEALDAFNYDVRNDGHYHDWVGNWGHEAYHYSVAGDGAPSVDVCCGVRDGANFEGEIGVASRCFEYRLVHQSWANCTYISTGNVLMRNERIMLLVSVSFVHCVRCVHVGRFRRIFLSVNHLVVSQFFDTSLCVLPFRPVMNHESIFRHWHPSSQLLNIDISLVNLRIKHGVLRQSQKLWP